MDESLRPKRDTTGRGDLTEMEVATALMRAGRKVLRPISAGLRYDLVIDHEDGTFSRVQCKTGILHDGCVEFRLYIADARRPNGVDYRGQVEAFGVFAPQIGRAYLVPIGVLGERVARLRLDPPRNGQTQGVRYADAFEIKPRGGAWDERLPVPAPTDLRAGGSRACSR